MSNRSKGNAYEKEVVAILEAQGWQCERALPRLVWLPGRRVPFSSSHDLFGAWDVCAVRPGDRVRWVQVSTWEQSGTKRKKALTLNWTKDHCQMEIWARVRGRPAHYKILAAEDGYVWAGKTELVSKQRKQELGKPSTGCALTA